MDDSGIVFKSAGDEPRPTVPLTFTTAVVCQRFPLTNTSVWSGDRPRNCAGRLAEVASATAGLGKFKEGNNRFNALPISVAPVVCRSLLVKISIGASESVTVRLRLRVPVTITACGAATSADGVDCCA